jgi:uracil-DNA glycosylase family 4
MENSSTSVGSALVHTDRLRAAIAAKGLKYVGTRGSPETAKICIAGEAPGADEDASGFPFWGASGREQDRMLRDAGYDIQKDVWYSNAYKVRPPDNEIARFSELGIDMALCQAQFIEELTQYKPTIIVTTGKTSTNILCPFTIPRKKGQVDAKKDGFGKWRGSLLTSPLLSWDHYVVPVYHPAFILRAWSERCISVLIYTRAREEAEWTSINGRCRPLLERNLKGDPSYDEVIQYLEECLDWPWPLSVDIESLWSSKLKIQYPYIFGIAKNTFDALAFSMWDYDGPRLVRIFRLLNAILSTKNIIGQNFTVYDAHWLRSIGLRPRVELVDDTLIRHHTLFPELEHSLAFMVMQYTREPYYKEDGKVHAFGTGVSAIRKYCCKDVCCTYEVWQEQEKEFQTR